MCQSIFFELLFIVGVSGITQQINGETKIKYSLYLIKLYAMCEIIGRDICYSHEL
jgi:hypothetical protein